MNSTENSDDENHVRIGYLIEPDENWIGYSSEDDNFIIYDRESQELGSLPTNISVETLRNLELISRTYLILRLLESRENFDNITDILMDSFEEYLEKYSSKKIEGELDIKIQCYETLSKSIEEEKECCICQEIFKNKDLVSVLECKHIYHEDCIRQWGKRKNNCPVCRLEISLKNDQTEAKTQE